MRLRLPVLEENEASRHFLALCGRLGTPVTQSTDLRELCARVEVATGEVLQAEQTHRRGYRNSKEWF